MTKHFGILLFQKGMLTVKTFQTYFLASILSMSKKASYTLELQYDQ